METMNDSHDLHLHLPYYNAITDEPQEELRGVCDGLSHAVLVGELSPGATFWVQRLNEFILVHKRNMSHEQMVPLVRLLYRLVTIPNLDFNLQERFARTLTKLILKKKSLSSHLIELPWRPLYDILRTIYFGQAETTIYVQRDKHGAAIVKLVEAARRFFPESATREILDEFQSKLCPHDVVLFDAQGWLVLFLPTNHVEGKPTHHELWLDWVFDVWGWVRDDVSTWNGQWLRLIARLVKGQPTAEVHALLEPHLDFLFNKFLSSLNLPVGASAAPKDHRAAMSSGAQVLLLPDGEGQHTIKRMCAIVAWLLSPEGRVIELLRALLRATESFFHPSNSGAWQGRLAQVLYCLCSEVCDRLKKERKPQCPTPPHLRLQDPQRKAFADCMSPVLVPALFSKSHSMVMTSALAHKLLAYICPEAILPQLLESVYPALQTLTESHQTLAALGCLCFVARPLLSKSVYPSGGEHLVNLLMLSLPGIDPNDPIKTETTFKFYRSVLQCVRIEDISGPSFTSELSEGDRQVCESTALLETWALEFLRLLFEVCSHHSAPAKSSQKTATAQIEANFSQSLRDLCLVFFAQLSPDIYAECLDRVFRYVTSSLVMKAMKPIGYMCEALVTAQPQIALKRFIPFLTDRISSSIRGSSPDDDGADKEVLWDIHMVSKCVKNAGPALMAHSDAVLSVVRDTIDSPIKAVAKVSFKLLKSILHSLSAEYPVDHRSYSPAQQESRVGLSEWGTSPDYQSLEMQWHTPNSDELTMANAILTEFMAPAMDRLAKRALTYRTGDHSEWNTAAERLELWRDLHIIRRCKAGADSLYTATALAVVPDENDAVAMSYGDVPDAMTEDTPHNTNTHTQTHTYTAPATTHSHTDTYRTGTTHSTVPMPRRLCITCTPLTVPLPVAVGATELQRLMVDVCETMLTTHADEVTLLCLLSKTLHAVTIHDLKLSTRLYEQKKIYQAMKVTCSNPLAPQSATRLMVMKRVHILYLTRRGRDRSAITYTHLHYHLLHCMALMSTTHYIKVRKAAQKAFNSAVRFYARAKYDLFPVLLQTLAHPNTPLQRLSHKSSAQRRLLSQSQPADSTIQNQPTNPYTHPNESSPTQLDTDIPTPTPTHTHTHTDGAVASDAAAPMDGISAGDEVTADGHDCVVKGGATLLNLRIFGRMMIRDFTRMRQALTAMCGSQNEDKASIQTMISKLFVQMAVQYCTLSLDNSVPDTVRVAAEDIRTQPLSDDIIAHGLVKAREANARILESYRELLNTLVLLLRGGTLHWRYELIMSSCLVMLLRTDEQPPVDVVEWYLDGCISDMIVLRRVALNALETILYCQRRKVTNKHWGTFSEPQALQRRERMFDPEHAPRSEEEYQRTVFVDKNWAGWQTSTLGVPYYLGAEGPYAGVRTDAEEAIRKRFSDEHYVEKFIAALDQEPPTEGMEMVQGAPPASGQFTEARANVFKILFREYGLPIFTILKPHLIRLCESDKRHSQWTAAEIIAGVSRGAKHWTYTDSSAMWDCVVLLVRKVFDQMPNEMISDWTMSVQYWTYDRDPRRMAPLLRLLHENPLRDAESQSAIVLARRLNFYRDSLTQLSWRGDESLRMLRIVTDHIDQPYKMVRDNNARCLLVIFSSTFADPQVSAVANSDGYVSPITSYGATHPQLLTFLESQLQGILTDLHKQEVRVPSPTVVSEMEADPIGMTGGLVVPDAKPLLQVLNSPNLGPEEEVSLDEGTPESEQRLKTVLTWLTLQFHSGCVYALLESIPLIMETLLTVMDQGHDEKVLILAKSCIHYIANTKYMPKDLAVVVHTLCDQAQAHKWRSRLSIVHTLQSLVFRNLFHLDQTLLDRVVGVLLTQLLIDVQVEVRSAAADTIGGLLRCDGRMKVDELNQKFGEMADTPLPKRNLNGTNGNSSSASLSTMTQTTRSNSSQSLHSAGGGGVRSLDFITRHGGVLGMSACILAYPYKLPAFVPELLCELGDHIADPEPIRSTVKTTLSDFRRTHQDNWHTLKSQFTDDQLSVLTDMLVSPSYYA